ncbi:MAG: aminodeoxychorismate/anthranilate synthase component II [Bacteroidetes bacterium]|nr:aminodeoxychorismate/anthranilate synthase component II [Bacteroidota bacterium]
MKIAVIDNYDSFVFNLVRYLREIPEIEVSVMRNRNVNYEILEKADGILLSPGPGIPDEAGDLMKIIGRFESQKPILGVCLGHQAIGQYFGLDLTKAEKMIHGKSTPILLNEKSELFEGINSESEPIKVGRYHSWVVRPNNNSSLIKITSTSLENEVMSLQHKSLPIFGVQFHPESVLTPSGRKMITNWIKTIP